MPALPLYNKIIESHHLPHTICMAIHSTLLYSTLLYSTLCYYTHCTVLYSNPTAMLHYPTVLYCTVLYANATLRYPTLPYATLRYSTLLYATPRYSTLLYATLLHSKSPLLYIKLNPFGDLAPFKLYNSCITTCSKYSTPAPMLHTT